MEDFTLLNRCCSILECKFEIFHMGLSVSFSISIYLLLIILLYTGLQKMDAHALCLCRVITYAPQDFPSFDIHHECQGIFTAISLSFFRSFVSHLHLASLLSRSKALFLDYSQPLNIARKPISLFSSLSKSIWEGNRTCSNVIIALGVPLSVSLFDFW